VITRPLEGGAAPRVIGLDLSIAASGYAETIGNEIRTTTIDTDPKHYSPAPRDTWRRLATVGVCVASYIGTGPPPALIVIEGPSYGSKSNTAHQLAGLWWLIYDALTRASHPLAVITPGELKKYATGKGTADKTAMAVALHRRAGLELGDDNRVDAWWLAAAALDKIRPEVSR
jgi:Holliday junction resolvasome RuvABC endonuclease subunit